MPDSEITTKDMAVLRRLPSFRYLHKNDIRATYLRDYSLNWPVFLLLANVPNKLRFYIRIGDREALLDQHELENSSKHAVLTDYSGAHTVTVDWGINEIATKEYIFRLSIDDRTALIDYEELLHYTRLI